MLRQSKQDDRVFALIQREGMNSLMNNTKWMRTIDALREFPLYFRVKLLNSEEVSSWEKSLGPLYEIPYLELPGSGGPVRLVEVEWLEIDPIEQQYCGQLVKNRLIDRTVEIEQCLNSLRVLWTKEQAYYRIWGHFRNRACKRS